MSYSNLKAAMRDHGVTQEMAAECLGMTGKNFNLKVNERIPMTVPEIKRIRDTYFPNTPLDYLCESDGDVASEQEKHAASLAALEDIARSEGVMNPVFEQAFANLRAEADERT